MLPQAPRPNGIRKRAMLQFGGYNHTIGAGNGEIWDMTNLSSDQFPVLSPRRPRYLLRTLEKPNGIWARDGLYYVDGTHFCKDGETLYPVSDSKKTFCGLGDYLVIFPDKLCWDTVEGTMRPMEASVTVQAVFEDGTYVGEFAEANTIRCTDDSFQWADSFQPGDAVTICRNGDTEHSFSIIIREIENNFLRFYENSFTNTEDGKTETVQVSRTVPDMDFLCENENRLWGCKGDTVYASKLGDPLNWNVFDGLSTDSWAADVGSAGDFTGCCAYLGWPVFFKEDHIYKAYGTKPSNFELMPSADLGVESGSGGSFGISGETLFYLSRTGVVAYGGGVPQSIAAPFGTDRYKNAVGGSDGIKYYVSMQGPDGYALFVYDTRYGLWHREDETQAVGFAWDGEFYCLAADGKLWMNGNARTAAGTLEPSVESVVEFGDFTEDIKGYPEHGANKKGTAKLQLRVELAQGAELQIWMQFDSDGVWRPVKTLEGTVKKSFYLPIIPRRSDHFRIKLEGKGDWKLYSLAREHYRGSELRSVL